MSEEKPKEKRGLLQRLFSDTKEPKKKSSADDSALAAKRKQLQRRQTVAEATFHTQRTSEIEAPPRKHSASSGMSSKPQQKSRQSGQPRPAGQQQQQKQKKKPSSKDTEGKRRRKKKAAADSSNVNVDTSKPLDWPCTPETLLEYHKRKPFLSSNEEWIVVELNEFECLVESIDIIRKIAKHSKFFELDPDELWEEFFEFVEEVPCYDDIINYDVWQEFRDKRYPC